jgi:peptidoglycan/LPS O-acetylase OafA/YrhL
VTDKASEREIVNSPGQSRRLVELDALRGIAAIVVVLFHLTTRYDVLFHHATPPILSVPWGYHGVNLFFMISGFVIFMTLHNVRRPLDFVVSRFTRLFPAFWGAVLVTFTLTHLLALPGKAVDVTTALKNLIMIHGMFNIPDVDGVYWTLEIELIFYAMAFLLYMVAWMERLHLVLIALIVLRLIYFIAQKYFGIELSWTFAHLLILPYIAWFACGIAIYRRVTFPQEAPRRDWLVLVVAIGQLALVEGIGIGILAIVLSCVLWAAASNKLPVLGNPVLVWLGAISYTLYLLHENIGWGVIYQAEQAGMPTNSSIFLAMLIVLALAMVMTLTVERPAMAWLRRMYRRGIVR